MRNPVWRNAIGAVLLAYLAGIAASPTAADEKSMVTVGEQQNGASVEIASGQTLSIRLPAQMGTGFSWAVTGITGGAIRLSGSRLEAGGKSMPGAVETQVFDFSAVTPGESRLELGYRQPWVKDKPPQRTFNLIVTVRGAS